MTRTVHVGDPRRVSAIELGVDRRGHDPGAGAEGSRTVSDGRSGMERARAQGVHVGRPAGTEETEALLAKATSQRVLALRADPGLSIQQAAQVAVVARNMVCNVSVAVGHVFG